MRKSYDFSNAVKNPHAKSLKNGYTIVIHHDKYDEVITVTKTKKLNDNNEKEVPLDSIIQASNP